MPNISKSREEEIQKILQKNLQKTRQRVGITASGLIFDLLASVSVVCVQSVYVSYTFQFANPLSIVLLSFGPTAGMT